LTYSFPIHSNNIREVRKYRKDKNDMINKVLPLMIGSTTKIAMYNSECEVCKKTIYPGEEICQAEGCKNYIHKSCCKKLIDDSESDKN
jgi:hypothetical protein